MKVTVYMEACNGSSREFPVFQGELDNMKDVEVFRAQLRKQAVKVHAKVKLNK